MKQKKEDIKQTQEKKETHKKPEKEKSKTILEKKEEEISDLTSSLQRLQAEFENYKKRIDKEKETGIKYAKADVIVKLLPILDSIELSLKNTCKNDDFVKGIEMIFAQFYSALENEGLRPIKALGEKFDPYLHEVLLKQDSDKDEDNVLEELQKGYMLGSMVLRTAKVKVSKKAMEKKCETDA